MSVQMVQYSWWWSLPYYFANLSSCWMTIVIIRRSTIWAAEQMGFVRASIDTPLMRDTLMCVFFPWYSWMVNISGTPWYSWINDTLGQRDTLEWSTMVNITSDTLEWSTYLGTTIPLTLASIYMKNNNTFQGSAAPSSFEAWRVFTIQTMNH